MIDNPKTVKSPAALEQFFAGGPQPAMMQSFSFEILEGGKQSKLMNFKVGNTMCVLAVLRATIDLMDAGMRRDFSG